MCEKCHTDKESCVRLETQTKWKRKSFKGGKLSYTKRFIFQPSIKLTLYLTNTHTHTRKRTKLMNATEIQKKNKYISSRQFWSSVDLLVFGLKTFSPCFAFRKFLSSSRKNNFYTIRIIITRVSYIFPVWICILSTTRHAYISGKRERNTDNIMFFVLLLRVFRVFIFIQL